MRRGPCHDFGNVHLYAEAPSYLVYVGRKVGLSSRVLLSLPLRLRPSRCHVDGAPFRPIQGPEAPILTLTLRNAGPEQGSHPRAIIVRSCRRVTLQGRPNGCRVVPQHAAVFVKWSVEPVRPKQHRDHDDNQQDAADPPPPPHQSELVKVPPNGKGANSRPSGWLTIRAKWRRRPRCP